MPQVTPPHTQARHGNGLCLSTALIEIPYKSSQIQIVMVFRCKKAAVHNGSLPLTTGIGRPRRHSQQHFAFIFTQFTVTSASAVSNRRRRAVQKSSSSCPGAADHAASAAASASIIAKWRHAPLYGRCGTSSALNVVSEIRYSDQLTAAFNAGQ